VKSVSLNEQQLSEQVRINT